MDFSPPGLLRLLSCPAPPTDATPPFTFSWLVFVALALAPPIPSHSAQVLGVAKEGREDRTKKRKRRRKRQRKMGRK